MHTLDNHDKLCGLTLTKTVSLDLSFFILGLELQAEEMYFHPFGTFGLY